MANESEKELERILQRINNLKKELGEQPIKLSDNDNAQTLNRLLQETRSRFENISNSASGLYSQLRGITSELKGQQSSTSLTRSAFRDIVKQARDLKNDELEINELNQSQLEKLVTRIKLRSEDLANGSQEVIDSNSNLKSLQQQATELRSKGESNDSILEKITKELSILQGISEEDKAILLNKIDENDLSQDLLDKAVKRLALEKEYNKRIGVTGALVKGTAGLMRKLGVDAGYLSDALKESQENMREAAKGGNKLQIIFKGLQPLATAFLKTITSTEVIVGKIVDAFFKVDKALVNVTRLTGQTSANFASLNSNIASGVDILEQSAEFAKATGLATSAIFSNDDLGRLVEAKNLLGLSAEQTNKLGLLTKVTNQNSDEFTKSLVKGVDAGNKLTDSVVAPGVALQDVLNVSDDITLSLGGSPTALGKAAAAARGLGLELGRVNSIADGLMDFESSIEAELEAQLLTGKQINLGKARELALNNDLVGVTQELAKNGASAAEFANMNRIQQSSLAKALGLSRDELAKSIIAQDTQNKLTDKQKKSILGVNDEQLKSLSVQEKLNKLVDKLAQSFSPVLEILVPLVDGLASIVTPLAKGIAATIEWSRQLSKFGPLLLGIGTLITTQLIRPLATIGIKAVTGFFTKFGSSIAGVIPKLLGMSAAQTATATSTTAMGTATKTSGKFIGSFFRSLSGGLMALANPAALLGLGAVTLSIIGIGAALRLAAPAIKAFGTVISAAFTGIVDLVKGVFEGFKSLLTELKPGNLLGLYALGPALLSASAGLAAFSLAIAGASLSSLVGGGVIDDLNNLASTAEPLSQVGTSLTVIASGIAAVAAALSSLETEKLNEIKDLVITTAFAAPAVAATGAITDLIAGITTTSSKEPNNSALISKIEELISVVRQGGDVYIDGNKVGESLMLASTKLS